MAPRKATRLPLVLARGAAYPRAPPHAAPTATRADNAPPTQWRGSRAAGASDLRPTRGARGSASPGAGERRSPVGEGGLKPRTSDLLGGGPDPPSSWS